MSQADSFSLAARVAAGERLSVVLEPDKEHNGLRDPLPRYVEAYPLPHVCAQDGRVWGATRRTHLVQKLGERSDSVVSFFYTDAAPLYGLFNHDGDMATLGKMFLKTRVFSAKQYRALRFETRPAGTLVWRSDTPDDVDALATSIDGGAGHYVVFVDGEVEDAPMRSHPLDLAFLFPDSGDVRVFAEHALLPEPFLNPRGFMDKLNRSVADLSTQLENRNFGGQSLMAAYPGYRRIDGNGASFGPTELLRNQSKPVRDIKIFASP